MSRIGRKTITLPKGVEVVAKSGELSVKGPKGSLSRSIADGISIAQDDGVVTVDRKGDLPRHRANHGLMRALLANMVTGVSSGFERGLEVVGVGYKAEIKGSSLIMNLGYSHPIDYPFPNGISIEVGKNNKITVKGIDKEKVGQVAAEIRMMRPPDSYKGKGVRYAGEYVRLKAGKTGQ